MPEGSPEFLKDLPLPIDNDLQVIVWIGLRSSKGFIEYRKEPINVVVRRGMLGDPAGTVRKTIIDTFGGLVVNPFLRLINIITETPEEVAALLYAPPAPPTPPELPDPTRPDVDEQTYEP